MEKIVINSAAGEDIKISACFWPAEGTPVGAVQICHGMAEHLARYEEFVKLLNENGFHVYGLDMPGHGESAALNDLPLGYFGKSEEASDAILSDNMKLRDLARERFGSDIPYYIYGHSMGSFVVRSIYSKPAYSSSFEKYVFSSTMGRNPAVGIGLALARLFTALGRGKKKGRLLTLIAFGGYTSRIKGAKTGFEWLTHDKDALQKYLDDPLCGFPFTNAGLRDLFKLVKFIQSDEAYKDLCKRPALFTYGEEDPVGGYGKGVRGVYERMKSEGAEVSIIDYGPYRHEIQNEEVAGKYYADIISFLKG